MTSQRFDDIPDPFGELAPAPPPPPAWPAAPARASVMRRRALAIAGILAYEVGFVAFVGLRPDLAALPVGALAIAVGGPLIAGILALRAALAVGPRRVGQASITAFATLMFGVGVFAGLSLFAAHGPDPEPSHALWTSVLGCSIKTTLLASVPVALSVVAYRRAFAANAPLRTAALAAACAALAAACMAVICPAGGPIHVALGHGSTLVVAAIVGLVLRRVTRA